MTNKQLLLSTKQLVWLILALAVLMTIVLVALNKKIQAKNEQSVDFGEALDVVLRNTFQTKLALASILEQQQQTEDAEATVVEDRPPIGFKQGYNQDN